MAWNKKGDMNEKRVPAELVLILIVLVIGIFIYINVTKASVKGLSCGGQGTCRSECLPGEKPYPFDFNQTCGNVEKGQRDNPICCVAIGAKENPMIHPQCSGDNKTGKPCKSVPEEEGAYFCDDSQQCVSRCEFCARTPSHALCNNIKNTNNQKLIKFNDRFICGCLRSECEPMAKADNPTCVMSNVAMCRRNTDVYCCQT